MRAVSPEVIQSVRGELAIRYGVPLVDCDEELE
jgi:hypothetical protein